MPHSDIVVLGGSAAGLAAAITARRYSGDKAIKLIRREPQVLVPCGIPYIYGTVGSPEKNLIPDAILEANGIELVQTEAQHIDLANGAVETSDGVHTYDRLVIATGSMPVVPPIPGIERKGVYTVQKEVPYLQNMLEAVNAARRCVIVGGGFIGVEFADEVRKGRDIDVSIVELLPNCLALAFEKELSEKAEDLIRSHGINLLTRKKVASIEGNGAVTGVRLEGGETILADLVLLAIGCRPNISLAKAAGLSLGPKGGIQVDRHMRTSDPRVFACGDCVDKVSFFDGKPCDLKLASIACMEGRVAGANLYSVNRENLGSVGVFSTAIDGTAFATAGLSPTMAREKGFDIVVGKSAAPNRHPGGMPGMAALEVSLVFDKATGRVLGGQAMGAESAGEIVNVISACIQGRMTAQQMTVFQMGTHPALTASPLVYQLTTAAEIACSELKRA